MILYDETGLYSGHVSHVLETELSLGFDRLEERGGARHNSDLYRLLERHVERLWRELPDQSRKRLECLAVSTGVGTTPENHATLVGAMVEIAEAEGTLEREAEFADTYLERPSICEWIAWGACEAGLSLGPSAGRPSTGVPRAEQKRLASDRHRDKKRRAKEASEERKQARSEARLETVREQQAIAIDGEGVTLPDGSHVYMYLAACTSGGTCLGELYDERGIGTRAALDFVAKLPKRDSEGRPYLGIFGYGLGYDQCKWLEDVSNKELFELFHSEDLEPKVSVGPYRLNLLGKCLQITNKKGPPGEKRTLVWDILKAFQATFVNALRAWKVGTEEVWNRIEAMKKQRGDFVNSDWDSVTAYCRDECKHLAMLVEKYVRAHCDAGIDLRGKYHGAGSTGDAFLQLMRAEEKRTTYEFADEDLLDYRKAKSAFSRAFFGGRAEVSRLGVVKGPVFSYDIGSAYPHALFSMPCVKHGKWSRAVPGERRNDVAKVARSARMAVVHFQIERQWGLEADVDDPGIAKRLMVMNVQGDASTLPWGALPYRTEKGSITFPASHPGGWSWMPEYEAARKDWPGVVALEAWCLDSDCKCERPFRAIGDYYLRRLEWGKEGPGIVLKLGLNSCYGKYAQVIGKNPKFACRIVAGYITASTRGRILEAIASADDPWSVVYVATDGILTDARIVPPDPVDNETKAGAAKKGKVMLGAWETPETSPKDNVNPDDHFVLQPGFYFSTRPKGKAKTRGMPLEIVDQERQKILDQWLREPLEPPRGLPKRSVFRGVKTSILRPTKTDSRYRRKPCYGKWETEDRELKYVINPKRSHAARLSIDGSRLSKPIVIRGSVPGKRSREWLRDGDVTKTLSEGLSYRLLSWWLVLDQDESAEYTKDAGHDEARASLDEQPDFVETPGTNVGD